MPIKKHNVVTYESISNIVDSIMKPYLGKNLKGEELQGAYDKCSSDLTLVITAFLCGSIYTLNSRFIKGQGRDKYLKVTNIGFAKEVTKILGDLDFEELFKVCVVENDCK
jgi:hypothetical protein